MSDFTWDDMEFWRCGEWDVVQEMLDFTEDDGKMFCPRRELLFAALDLVALKDVTVLIMGQDPYPNPALATGVAFSVPPSTPDTAFPPTLQNIFEEYHNDTHLSIPSSGDLTKWCKQGVLLWNAIPSCQAWKSKSHDWPEWKLLTQEIVDALNTKGIVFVFLGREAQKWKKNINLDANTVIETSHPSPLGYHKGFKGSRIFTRINEQLVSEHGYPPINWAL